MGGMLEVVEVDLVPGLVVAGKYRLERPIGKGGFGVVWAAVDVATGEPRALKCLTQDGATDAKRQERLRREARAMSSITHPHIARVFAVEELAAGTPFIVMELLAGRTLHAHLSRGPLSVPQARGVLIQIADALRTVHARGIVHRDLKPANVIIVDERTVKVLDFGIAKDLSAGDRHRLTTTGTALGTLYYMAPEQIFGERNLDGRCDVWALGVVAHECLTLRRPTDVDGDNSGQVLKAILDGNFPRLSTMVRDCPPDLDGLVARMLSRNPAERPTSEEVFALLSRPALAPTAPRSLGKTSNMVETLALLDAPMFAQTVRDENFASSQLAPSTVVPSTVVPSTVVPSTVVPSTVVPRTVPDATLASAEGMTPGIARTAAPAVTPPQARPANEPTFDIRARHAESRPRGLAIALAVFAAVVVIGIAVLALGSARARRVETTPAQASASATSTSSQTAEPAPAVSIASSPSATASSTPVVPAMSASAATAPSAAAAATATSRRAAASPARGSTARPAAPTNGDPPISDERF